MTAPATRSISHSPIRNHDLFREVVQARHDFSRQQCEHQHFVSGLKYRLEKETQNAVHAAEAEKYHLTYEIKRLEEERDSISRLGRGEEERMAVRRKCFDNEISNLTNNLAQSQNLINDSKKNMTMELQTRENDFQKMMLDLKDNYEKRIAIMRDDHDKAIFAEKDLIAERERELDRKNLNIYF